MKGLKISAVIGLILFSVTAFLPQFHFVITLLKSMALPIGIATFLIGIIYLLFKKKLFAGLFMLVSLSFIAQIEFWNWEKHEYSKQIDLRIAHINVLKFNKKHDDLLEDLDELAECDIISFQEVDFAWSQDILAKLQVEFPHIVNHPREDCYGLMVLSKKPFVSHHIHNPEGLPQVEIELSINSQPTSLVFMHASTPMNSVKHKRRNKQLKSIEQLENKPAFVVGDFNSVTWDEHIKSMKKANFLRDSRNAYQGTYPSQFFLKIPIDYIFYNQNWACSSFQVLKKSTSDHLGIIGTYYLK